MVDRAGSTPVNADPMLGDPYLSGDEGFPDRRWVFHAWKRRTGEFKDFDGSEIS